MIDKLFLDTSVVLDLLGERVPHYDPMAKIASLAEKEKLTLVTSALSYATVFYILSKYERNDIVKEKLRKFRVLTSTSDLTDQIIDKGLSSKFTDFEDALQYHCAIQMGCKILLTRNEKDFSTSDIPVMTPREYLISKNVK